MSVSQRFWSKVKKSSECWNWTAATNRGGYGVINLGPPDYERVLSHRYSWMASRGSIPDGLNVLHRCDNPRCVNPEHLFLGTQQDNLKDMRNKGRQSFGRFPKGEQHYFAKLTIAKANAIRSRYKRGVIRMKDLAKEYGVSITTVDYILKRKIWNY